MLYCPCAKTSADGQLDVQPTNRRISHHNNRRDLKIIPALFISPIKRGKSH